MNTKKYKGDDSSVGLELIKNISEEEERSRAIEEAVSEGYFELDKALDLYKVTKEYYLSYLNSKK